MAKDKKRKQNIKHDGLVSDEARYVLVGLLIFLLCFIGLIERGGYLGNVVSYVFVFVFGVFWFIPLILVAFLGLYLFIRRKMPTIKIGVSLMSILFFFIFLLIGASESEVSIANVFSIYNDRFQQITGNGWKVVIDAQVGGGFLGFIIFALLSDLLTNVGARIVYILGLILTLFLFLKPALFKLVSFIKDDEKYERKTKKKTKSHDNKLFRNLYEELNLKDEERKEKEPLTAREKFIEDEVSNVSVETFTNSTPSSYKHKKESSILDFDDFFASSSSNNKNKSFDIFTDNLFEEKQVEPAEKEYRVKGYDIFSDDMFFDHKTVVKEEVIRPVEEEYLRNKVEEETISSHETTLNPFIKEKVSTPIEKVIDVSDEDFFTASRNKVEEPQVEVQPVKQNYQSNVFKSDFAPDTVYMEQKTNTNEFKQTFAPKQEEKVVEEVKREEVKVVEEIKPVMEEVSKVETLTPQEAFDAKNDPTIKPRQKPYKLPSMNLLNDIKYSDQNALIENAQIKSVILDNKMKSLSINGKVSNFVIAPAFTRYEIQVESNVRVSLFNQYKNDLMMALAAETIRILAPIPGSSVVGIEIPNKERISVSFKESMLGLPFDKKDKKLLVAMGKDVEGKVVSVQIDKTPHLLVAGTTGSGKSVCINTIIMSILMRTSPDEVKMILVDPKRVELSIYANMPHLLCPVITDAKKASVALKKVCEEMDLRYGILEKTGKKNIEVYNSWQTSRGGKALPYIVVIVDELADLMQVAMSDVEDSIRRITQLARAAGIHLIVATQRPSVDVITGVIKANIPSRCAFTVSSNADSRTILDEIGAENLLGMGDMLLKLTGSTNCQRVQGCYVTDEEIEKVVEYVKSQREPEYDVNFLNLDPPKPEQLNFDGDIDEDYEDPVYLEILDLIKRLDTISASYLQRKFGMGFPKAGRYIDRLEKEGYIGEQQGSKPREVLKRE
ncbi:MAG: DNA translocase FtsK [Bacilli bacterium]|nr:DNA translocase FtsK [Bacilli bacterium]